ncbi:MAG: helix-turn-helix transcriptional regulator [Alphaproteobacteria bacterium]|nr:MAG: helix-turn-helix transcriptional regulator [Alphaproteobacteria bacterium]
MITAKQVRMARAAMDWTIEDLAGTADLAPRTIQQVERGAGNAQETTLRKLQETFESRGLEFTPDNGVREHDRTVTILESENAYLDLLDDVSRTLGDTGGEVLIAFNQGSLSTQEVVDRWLRMRRAGVRVRALCDENDSFHRTPLKEVRLVPSRYFINQLSLLYGNKVSFNVNGRVAKKIILVENELIAAQQRNMFDFFWHNGKMPKESTCPEDQRYDALLKG